MTVGKFLMIMVLAMLFGVAWFVFQFSHSPAVSTQQSDNFFSDNSSETKRRADDPTYSEELRRNTELTRETQNRQRNLEADLNNVREAMTSSREQQQETKDKVENVSAQVKELQRTLESSNKPDPALAKQMAELNEKLTGMQELQQQQQAQNETREARIRELEGLLEQQKQAQVVIPPDPKSLLPDNGQQGDILQGITTNTSQTLGDTDGRANNGNNQPRSHITLPYGSKGYAAASQTGNNDILSSVLGGIGNIGNPVPPAKLQPGMLPVAGERKKEDQWQTVFPVYTLPPSTILSDALLVTPIIGRVPLERSGNIEDPFFFKVEIGGKNLAANGHQIPGVAKMIASGYATGVREQECARGYIDSLTFIFIDGRIVTQGKTSGEGSSSGKALGYLTDPWGTPCIRGRYISNAGDYIKSRGMAAFVEAAADALSQGQVSYRQDSNGNYSAMLDGSIYPYIFGRGVSGTAKEIADYIRERTSAAFDVIYVAQGKPVQIMINDMIQIDYDANARKVNYYREPKRKSAYD